MKVRETTARKDGVQRGQKVSSQKDVWENTYGARYTWEDKLQCLNFEAIESCD
jgi:hypothetical protein